MVEIYTYGNGAMLAALLQAVTALTATDDFLKLVRIMFVITTLVVAFEIAWTGRFKPTARLFGIIVLLNAAILTTTDVQLTDRVNSANDTLIADVPAGLAVPLSYATAIGDWATQAFESIFSLPNDLKFQANGMLFASRLVEASTQYEVTDPRMAANLSEFAEGCIYYGILADWFTLESVLQAGNIWASLPSTAFGNAVFVEYRDNTGTTTMLGCRDARDSIEADWNTAITEMASVYGQRMFPQYAEAAARARLLSTLPQSYLFMAGISQNAADTIRQNAMINTIRRSFTRLASNYGAPAAAQDFALAQAEAQQRTTYATLGALAGRMMSLFRNVLETLIYGIFPLAIIFIMISLMQGKALFTYLKLLFWLQLWPPMYAILNYAMSVYGAEAATAAATQAVSGTPVLNMLTNAGIAAVNSDMSAMAGYLSWMIPMFSWALVSGSGFAASQLAASLGSVAQSSGASAARDVSTGNLSLGNYSAYNGSMWQQNTAPTMNRGIGRQMNPATGATVTTTASGLQFANQPTTSMPFSANLSSAMRSSVNTMASQSMQAAKTAASAFAATTSATMSNMQRLAQMAERSNTISDGVDKGLSAQFKQDMSRLNQILDSADFGQGLSRQQKAQMLAAASAGVMVAGSGARAGFNVEGASASQETWKKAKKYAQDSKFQEAWSAAQSSGQKLSAQMAERSGDSTANEIAGGFQDQRAASRNLQASMSEAQAWQRMASQLKEAGSAGSMEATAALIRFGNAQLKAEGAGITMQQLAAQSASTTGDSAGATARLQGIINSFVQSGEAAKLAGIDTAAPSADGVRQANAANQAAVRQATEDPGSTQAPGSGSVKAWGAGAQGTIGNEAENRGLPSAGTIEQRTAALRGEVSGDLSSNNAAITSGGNDVQRQVADNQKQIESDTDPGNQNHLGYAGVEFGANVASTGINSVSGMKDAAAEVYSSIMGSGDAPPSQSSTGNRGVVQGDGPNGDLPPLDWDVEGGEGSGRSAPQAPSGGVGNRLRD